MAKRSNIRKNLETLNECIKDSLQDIKLLKDEALKEFKDIFQIEEDNVEIYFNDYNIVLFDPIAHEAVKPYLKQDSLVLRLEIPEFDSHIWIYQYFNERIFNDYLK